MKTSEFFSKIESRDSNLRMGQAAFNLLYDVAPEIAEEIHGTDKDPFYDDFKLGAFLRYLFEREFFE